MSHWLAELERVAGTPLVVRGRKVQLPPAGHLLRRLALTVLGDVARTGREMDDTIEVRFGKRGLERIAVTNVRFDQPVLLILKVGANVLTLGRWIIEVIEIINDRHAPVALSQK